MWIAAPLSHPAKAEKPSTAHLRHAKTPPPPSVNATLIVTTKKKRRKQTLATPQLCDVGRTFQIAQSGKHTCTHHIRTNRSLRQSQIPRKLPAKKDAPKGTSTATEHPHPSARSILIKACLNSCQRQEGAARRRMRVSAIQRRRLWKARGYQHTDFACRSFEGMQIQHQNPNEVSTRPAQDTHIMGSRTLPLRVRRF